jgi:putative oxidoreductase
MKNTALTFIDSAAFSSWVLAVFRIVIGLIFLEFGTAMTLHFPYLEMFDHLPLIVKAAGLLHLIGGVALISGYYARTLSFLLSGEMAVGYFSVHAPQGFFPIQNGGLPAITYCFCCLYLFAAGPGKLALNRR